MTHIAIENDPVEIVDFPNENSDLFHSYVKLPEGTLLCDWWHLGDDQTMLWEDSAVLGECKETCILGREIAHHV